MKYILCQSLDMSGKRLVRLDTDKPLRFQQRQEELVIRIVNQYKDSIVLTFFGDPKTFVITEHPRELYISLDNPKQS